MKITTKWGEKIDKNNPLPEYPRPQFERDSFINLNGVWSYLISKKKTEIPTAFEGEIVVPFSPECQLSGVERVVMPDDFLYYEREFDLPEEFIKRSRHSELRRGGLYRESLRQRQVRGRAQRRIQSIFF